MMNVTLKLYHGKILIGTITELSYETPWYSGSIVLTEDAEPYKEFFAHMVDEDKQFEELPFDEALLDDWFIEDVADGERFEASYPSIEKDGEMAWQMWPLGTMESVKNGD